MLGIGVRKTIKKTRQLLYRWSYRMLFSIRRGRIKEFDKLVKTKDAFFTVELHQAGFTDQLIQFVVFYSIGKWLNCQYYFTELDSSRSSVSKSSANSKNQFEDIYDFLGFHDYLRTLAVPKPTIKSDAIPLELDAIFFNERGLVNKKDLISYLKYKLYPSIKAQDEVHIKIRLKGFSSFFGSYNILEGCKQTELDFRSAFKNRQDQSSWRSSGKYSRHNMVVHIRQGDTAVVQTPWNTFVNLWRGTDTCMKEFETHKEARIYRHIEVKDYHNFLCLLGDHLKDDLLYPIRIFSDGYKRAFKHLIDGQEQLNWPDSKIKHLQSAEESYERERFGLFQNHEQFELTVGEEVGKLYNFIYRLLQADVVVIGTQQRMVPKFLSVYCTPENMPLVIVLYDKRVPSRFGLGRSELLDNYLLVDINDYDISAIANKIKNRIQPLSNVNSSQESF